MAYQSIWYFTDLPDKIVDIIEEDLKDNFDPFLQDSKIGGGGAEAPPRSGQPTTSPLRNGVANTGGGGVGAGPVYNAGSGGSGIVIIRYALS